MKSSPLIYKSHNIEIPEKWRSVISHPGFLKPEPAPSDHLRAYSVKGVPKDGAKELVVLEDKFGQLSNPLNALLKIQEITLSSDLSDITKQVEKKGISPAHFNAVSPYKAALPNVIFSLGKAQVFDAFFVGVQNSDTVQVDGTLHCVYKNSVDSFDYLQLTLSQVARSTLGLLIADICQNLENQLK